MPRTTTRRAATIDDHEVACSIARTLQVIGDRWTLLILRDAFRGVRRFDEFASDLGIARNLLADRLSRLVQHGILAKVPYSERPLRHEYRLTDRGLDLSPALVALMRWGDKHLAGDEPPVVLLHKSCGHPFDQVFVCRHCDETLTPRQITSDRRC
ncbi:MAG TPA: helix-turn-helix domain-containing protein [Acidimicrobiales bacterium]